MYDATRSLNIQQKLQQKKVDETSRRSSNHLKGLPAPPLPSTLNLNQVKRVVLCLDSQNQVLELHKSPTNQTQKNIYQDRYLLFEKQLLTAASNFKLLYKAITKQEKEKQIQKLTCSLIGACMDQKQFRKEQNIMTYLYKNVNLTQDVVDLLDKLWYSIQQLTKENVLDMNKEAPDYDYHTNNNKNESTEYASTMNSIL